MTSFVIWKVGSSYHLDWCYWSYPDMDTGCCHECERHQWATIPLPFQSLCWLILLNKMLQSMDSSLSWVTKYLHYSWAHVDAALKPFSSPSKDLRPELCGHHGYKWYFKCCTLSPGWAAHLPSSKDSGKSLVNLHLDSRRADRLQRTLRVGIQHSTSGCHAAALA